MNNKTYLPSDLINNNYKYTISNGIIRVITNNNCVQNYNSTYCDCYDVYINNDYLVSNSISCNSNPNTYLSSNRFTSDYYYRVDFVDILLIFMILSTFIIYIPYKVFARILGKWVRL